MNTKHAHLCLLSMTVKEQKRVMTSTGIYFEKKIPFGEKGRHLQEPEDRLLGEKFLSLINSIPGHSVCVSRHSELCLTLCNLMDCRSTRLLCPWGFSRQEYWRRLQCLPLQGIFPTQQSNPGLPDCRRILYHLKSWFVQKQLVIQVEDKR